MFYWIYDIPTVLVIGLFSAVFIGVCWLGIILLGPFAKSWFHQQPQLNEILGNFLHYFGVIYGLLLGLLAIATYQDHSDVQKAVAGEASSLAALYRDVTAYPEPSRTKLQDLLRGYTRSVIDDAWPLQRKGIVPADGVAAFQAQLVLFEPQTKGQEALHETALRQFNTFYEYRRTQLYSVYSGIPAILWYTVAVGALINMLLIWLFDLRLHAHWLLGGLISFYLATIISVIALLDHPLRGKLGVSPEAFQLVYDQLMRQ